MNYVDDAYVIDELSDIHRKGYDIEVNWKTREFFPETMASPRIEKSIGYWCDSLNKHLESHNVELKHLETLKFQWPSGQRKLMFATDDRGKEYKIYVNEVK